VLVPLNMPTTAMSFEQHHLKVKVDLPTRQPQRRATGSLPNPPLKAGYEAKPRMTGLNCFHPTSSPPSWICCLNELDQAPPRKLLIVQNREWNSRSKRCFQLALTTLGDPLDCLVIAHLHEELNLRIICTAVPEKNQFRL
jgi:hypothetical protein